MVSEPSVLRPQSMDEMEQQIMFEMSENLQKQKQSTETIKFQIEKLLQSQAKLIQSQAKLQKNLESMMPRFFEEFHQTQETVTNPDPFVETVKNSDPLIEPLDCSSVLQVLASVPDVLMVDRVDSHVKEVEELPQKSTSGNDNIVAHQLFDQMPNACQKDLTVNESSNKEVLSFSHKDARVWEPGGLPTTMDHWDWFEKELKSYGESHKAATFLYSHMQVVKSNPAEFKTFDRKRSNKTLLLEDEQDDGHEQNQVMKLISSWHNRIWEPGGVLIEHDEWKGLEKCYKRGNKLMRLMHWLPSMWWKETKSREFDRLSACSWVTIKTWHCVKHETDFHVWHRWKNKAEKLPADYAVLELLMLGLGSFQSNKGNGVVGLVPKAIWVILVGSFSGGGNKEVSLVHSGKSLFFFAVYAVSAYDQTVALEKESFLPPEIIREFEIMNCYMIDVFMNGLRYLMKRLELHLPQGHNKTIRTHYEKAEKVDKHKINFRGKFAESIIVAMTDEHKDIKTACVLLEMGLNTGRLIRLGAPPVFSDLLCAMNRIQVRLKMVLLLEFLWLILFSSKMSKSPYVPQNKNQTNQKLSSYWKLLLMLLYALHNNEWRSFYMLMIKPVFKGKEETVSFNIAVTSCSRFCFFSYSSWMVSHNRYGLSSCVLREEKNYVMVLFPIGEALTLVNDQHTLVAQKKGTETSTGCCYGSHADLDLMVDVTDGTADISTDEFSSVCKLLFGDFVLNLIADQVRDWSFFGLLLQWKWHPPPQATSEFHQAHNDKPVFHL